MIFPTAMEILHDVSEMPCFRPERGMLLGIRRPGRPQSFQGRRRRNTARKDHGKSKQAPQHRPEGRAEQGHFAKAQKDVEKSAKELVKLAKEAKKIKDVAKKAKDVANPEKKWDEYIDEFVKTCEELDKVAGKSDATFQDAKEAFNKVKNACADCHKDFRKDEVRLLSHCPSAMPIASDLSACPRVAANLAESRSTKHS